MLNAQDLAPRAYLITPLHANAVTLTWGFYSGGLNFNDAVPIVGATGNYNVPVFSYYHSLNFFGRSANVIASLPYAVGTFSGEVLGNQRSVYRSGLLDFSARLSVNLLGGPAMQPQQFSKWKQKKILGASLKIVAPTGQYDPTKLINWGINRWAFKPELGYSQRWGRLGPRRLCRSVVLHDQFGILQYSETGAAVSISRRKLGRTFQLRLQEA